MNGNFAFHNPTRLHFGENAMEFLKDEGLTALEVWMREISVAMNITELGAVEAMIPDFVKATFRLNGGYKQLTEEEVGGRGDIPPEPVTALSHAKFANAAKMTGDVANLADLA